MNHKVLWCYFKVLILLDISLNTKLCAQGKSHGNGVSVHESLIEEISLQEWGGAGGGAGVLAAWPRALAFGRCALGEAHARLVTLTNAGNDSLHLASVAGTTPDFHASFFDTKTLSAGGNTTLSVVFVGRREGPVSTQLLLHTSRGVLRYPVSAAGAASAWRVWPLVGLHVPRNATLRAPLTLYNPTERPVQVRELYSSAAWVRAALPAGRASAPRAAWLVPPRARRTLALLAVGAPPPGARAAAYVRVRGDLPGGALVLPVDAAAAAAGEYLQPPHVRLGARGSLDAALRVPLAAGNSAAAASRLAADVWGARCEPHEPREPPPPPPPPPAPTARANGSPRAPAAPALRLTRDLLPPHQTPVPVAELIFDFAALWASAGGGAGAEGVWCDGWVRVGRATLPYSVRVVEGTLAPQPPQLRVAAEEAAWTPLVVRSVFSAPLEVWRVHAPPPVRAWLQLESLAPLAVAAGAEAAVARVRARAGAAGAAAAGRLLLLTNASEYAVPVLLQRRAFELQWEEGGGADGALAVRAAPAEVRARLVNAGAAPLCVERLGAHLPPPLTATFEVEGARCAAGGGAVRARLALAAHGPARRVRGRVCVRAAEERCAALAVRGTHSLRAPPVALDDIAPYAGGGGVLAVCGGRARLTRPPLTPTPALTITHGDLSKPSTNARGRISAMNSWEELAHLLNSNGCGDTKSTEKWKKVWSDFKNNTKKKAARLHRAASGTGGGPAVHTKLTDLEERVLNLMGLQTATGLASVEAGLLQINIQPNTNVRYEQQQSPIPYFLENCQNENEPTRAIISSPPHTFTETDDRSSEHWNEPGPSTYNVAPAILPRQERPATTPPMQFVETRLEDALSPTRPSTSRVHTVAPEPALSGQTTPRRARATRTRRTPRSRLVRPAHMDQAAQYFLQSEERWRALKEQQHQDYIEFKREQNRIRELEILTQREWQKIGLRALDILDKLANKYCNN